MSLAQRLVCALGSAALLHLAYPMNDLGLLAWVGLVPLLFALGWSRPAGAFVLSALCGFAYFSGVLIWVYHIPGFRPVHHLLVGLYLAPFFGVFGLLTSLLARRRGLGFALAAAPFTWVSLELLRTNASFLSLPWGFLAHTQYRFPAVIQVSALTGAYGVSFLVVAVNAALAAVLFRVAAASRVPAVLPLAYTAPSRRAAAAGVCCALSLVAASVMYGRAVLSVPRGDGGVRVSVLQGNISREMKKDPRAFALPIMQTYLDLTAEAARDEPDLVVWPEAATPGLVLKQPELLSLTTEAVMRVGTPFLVGSSEYPKFSKEAVRSGRRGNTALYFSPLGKVVGQYLKIHLVPFGEEIPLEGVVPWPGFIVPEQDANWDLPGTERTLFALGRHRFGVVICWEQVFPGLVRDFVRDGADFMLNITNEGWFGDSAAPHQMLAISVFRAVENRVPLARAANTGISGFIDRFGRIDGLVSRNGKPTFVRGHLTRMVYPATAKTFYTRRGDVFAAGCVAAAAGMVLVALGGPGRRASSEGRAG